MCSTKASINRLGLSTEIVSSKDAMVIWLRGIPVMCCMFKNKKFAVFIQIVFYIWKNIMEVFSQTDVSRNSPTKQTLNVNETLFFNNYLSLSIFFMF